ncbi:MAG: hypothetical protein WD648_16195 [Planctomycetaceae bacterium]
MICRIIISTALTFIFSASFVTARAQDFEVYTRVYDESAAAGDAKATSGRKSPIARSLTMFHAGKAYDYIEAIGEVVVIDFDPAMPHYMLLSTRRELATSVHFEEVKNTLQVAARVADESIQRMETQGELQNPEAIGLHRFQRAPAFEETFDAKSRRLTLSSPFLRYDVACQEPVEPAFVDAYLRYADAICRLNYILYPSLVYPESRLALNEALRLRKTLPTEVRLRLNLTNPVSLRAEHKITWKLDRTDRRNIGEWETMLNSKRIRRVTLHEYQQEVLGALAKNQR